MPCGDGLVCLMAAVISIVRDNYGSVTFVLSASEFLINLFAVLRVDSQTLRCCVFFFLFNSITIAKALKTVVQNTDPNISSLTSYLFHS